jgi:metal-responsive CopG/Arc/MetJ family transcriptional regulator
MRKTLRMVVRTRVIDWTYEPRPEPKRIPVNLSLPEDLVKDLDAVAGPRNRSAFAEQALRRAIKREQFRIAGEKVAGSLDMRHYPHWRTSEDVVKWVREMRAEETSTDIDPE